MSFSTSVVLVCAVLASLAGGVALAYVLCLLMFESFRMHSERVHQEQSSSPRVKTARLRA